MEQTTLTFDNKQISATIGQTVAQIINGEQPCGGHGKCGKCKVVARGSLSAPSESELRLLSADELARGVRLACSARVLGECEISTIRDGRDSVVLTDADLPEISLCPDFERLGVALDIGTTTLAARLYSSDGELLSSVGELNPQSSFGADVISRIEASLASHKEELASLILSAIDKLIFELCSAAGRTPDEIGSIVLTGNTAMLYFLTKSSPLALSRAPFLADRLFSETLGARELGLNSLAPDTKVYLPPCISAFVGADTVCALLATKLCDSDAVRMLVDIGTNGEMALFDGTRLYVCSTAAGPAFEGVGISSGMRGETGAIDKVTIVNGALHSHTVGGAAARGICGSGIVDAAACMLELELMDETGFLEDGDVTLAEGVTLTQNDIRALQLAKSAIYSGLCTLAKKCGAELESIAELKIAGGFGKYLNIHSATRIGLLPREVLGRTETVGNAALAGASMLLLDVTLRKKAEEIAKRAEVVGLASDPVFSELYMSSMLF